MMKSNRIYIALYIGYAIYSLLIFMYGDRGLQAERELHQYETVLRDNIDELKTINSHLVNDFQLLNSDSDTVKLRSRQMGYFGKGEKVIRVDGLTSSSKEYPAGNILKREFRRLDPSPQFRAAGISAAVLIYLLSFLILRPVYDPAKRPTESI